MNLQHIPFFISWEVFENFIITNFPTLILSDDCKFITFILVQFIFIFCIYLIVKIAKFIILLFKNMIFR